MTIYYFGTDLERAGHYYWELTQTGMERLYPIKNLPFDPEGLVNNLPEGESIFYKGGGRTVIGYSGSCSDSRPGCKTIFWVGETMSEEEFTAMLKGIPTAIKILAQLQSRINNKNNE